MTLAKAFGDRLAQERREKAARERRDVTQKDIAKAVQLTSAAISKYESGVMIPDDAILQRLADYFGVRRVWLREGEGDRTTAPEKIIDVPLPTDRPMRPTISSRSKPAAKRNRG